MTQPNILFIQADQLAADALPTYGNGVVKAPHITQLAEAGAQFDAAYCNFPLCAPSRFSMMTGQLPSRIRAFDNAAEFPSELPTFAHYLRRRGYQTCLSGKMHFVGADQLHGFEERLTTDIYPSDFSWSEKPGLRDPKTTSAPRTITDAGPCRRAPQLDYDELVMFQASQKLYDLARGRDERPFLLCVSLTHPHDPFYCPPEQWARYQGAEIPPPRLGPIPLADQDPLHRHCTLRHQLDQDFSEADILKARRGYYGSVSYVDDQVGRLMALLEALDLRGETVVIVTSDHGEMLGERGLWFKRHFFEPSARVPLIFNAPEKIAPQRRDEVVSLVDLLPTLLGLAGDASAADLVEPIEGRSLLGLLRGETGDWENRAYSESMSDGMTAPVFMVRRDRHKLIFGPEHPHQLFDLESDPGEVQNLAGQEASQAIEAALLAEGQAKWDAAAIQRDIDLSIERRIFLREALRQGRRTSWDFQPASGDAGRWCPGDGDYNAWAFDIIPA